ncbi:hypothetical protein FQR65_LT20099 [Abscondita terminalis]|nr:hypothetical protein FQR65_LT20099 [Abscondita terminalis]
MVNVLRLADVTYVRNGRPILDGINWAVEDSERWVILGPNGAGKTTLMKLATASDYPTRGSVDVLGRRLGQVDVFELRNRVGFVSSASARRIPRSEIVRDVVLTAAYAVEGRWNEHYDAIDVRQAERILAEWDLAGFVDQRFGTLSDGERKRAMIARAVMTDPEMLLLDEPSASLDLGARERLLQMLSGFASSASSPAMVMVTHHVEEVPPGFTHAMLLREGRIAAAGPIAETLTAANLEATFGMPFDLTIFWLWLCNPPVSAPIPRPQSVLLHAHPKAQLRNTMKTEIHPEYNAIVFRDLASGETFLTRSTLTSEKTIELDGVTYPVVRRRNLQRLAPLLHG